jgi:hypothetical protein
MRSELSTDEIGEERIHDPARDHHRAYPRTDGGGRPRGLAADPAQDTNVSTEGTQRSDLTTYRANAGAVPGQTGSATFMNPTDNATRLFVIQVLYQAYNAQFGVDRVP